MRWQMAISLYSHLSSGYLSHLNDFSGRSSIKSWIMDVLQKKLFARRNWKKTTGGETENCGPLVIDVSRPFDSIIHMVIFTLQVSRCVPDCASPRFLSFAGLLSTITQHGAVYCRTQLFLFFLSCVLFAGIRLILSLLAFWAFSASFVPRSSIL